MARVKKVPFWTDLAVLLVIKSYVELAIAAQRCPSSRI